MKHGIYTFFQLTLMLIVLFGCSAGRQETKIAPGPVLGLDQGDGNSQKIVTFQVVGKGLEPENALTKGEAKLMAERAAVADGYRQLVEKIKGVYVDAFMEAGFGTVSKDMISTKTQSWLRGAEILEIRRAEYDITEAVMQLSIYFSKKDMVWWPSGLGPRVTPVGDTVSSSSQSQTGN